MWLWLLLDEVLVMVVVVVGDSCLYNFFISCCGVCDDGCCLFFLFVCLFFVNFLCVCLGSCMVSEIS